MEKLCSTYLNNVEYNVLVEAVQDAFGYTVVIPGSMDEQQILQVFELCGREEMEGNDMMNEERKPECSTALIVLHN